MPQDNYWSGRLNSTSLIFRLDLEMPSSTKPLLILWPNLLEPHGGGSNGTIGAFYVEYFGRWFVKRNLFVCRSYFGEFHSTQAQAQLCHKVWIQSLEQCCWIRSTLAGLWLARKMQVKKLLISCDSQLVVSQVNRSFIARNNNMTAYLKLVMNVLIGFEKFELIQILHLENIYANALSKLASRKVPNFSK